MIAYKAFYPGLKSFNGMHFNQEKTYKTKNRGVGCGGFHAALDPMFCLSFVSPEQNGEYHEVELGGVIDEESIFRKQNFQYTAVTGETLKIGRKLTVEEMLQKSYEYRLSKCTKHTTGNGSGLNMHTTNDTRFGTASVSGSLCIAEAKDNEAEAYASGERCVAIAKGNNSIATIGEQSTNCLAIAKGKGACIGGCMNTWLLFITKDKSTAVRIDGRNYLPGKLYKYTGGKIKEIQT